MTAILHKDSLKPDGSFEYPFASHERFMFWAYNYQTDDNKRPPVNSR